jgi:hypothetical protein
MQLDGYRCDPGSANPWAIGLTPPWPPTWAPVQLGWAAAGAACAGAARSTCLCLTGLATAGASSATAGAAIRTAPKMAAVAKSILFICPSPTQHLEVCMRDNRINRAGDQKPNAASMRYPSRFPTGVAELSRFSHSAGPQRFHITAQSFRLAGQPVRGRRHMGRCDQVGRPASAPTAASRWVLAAGIGVETRAFTI